MTIEGEGTKETPEEDPKPDEDEDDDDDDDEEEAAPPTSQKAGQTDPVPPVPAPAPEPDKDKPAATATETPEPAAASTGTQPEEPPKEEPKEPPPTVPETPQPEDSKTQESQTKPEEPPKEAPKESPPKKPEEDEDEDEDEEEEAVTKDGVAQTKPEEPPKDAAIEPPKDAATEPPKDAATEPPKDGATETEPPKEVPKESPPKKPEEDEDEDEEDEEEEAVTKEAGAQTKEPPKDGSTEPPSTATETKPEESKEEGSQTAEPKKESATATEEASDKKAAKRGSKKEDEAATKIQAQYRGYRTRKSLEKHKKEKANEAPAKAPEKPAEKKSEEDDEEEEEEKPTPKSTEETQTSKTDDCQPRSLSVTISYVRDESEGSANNSGAIPCGPPVDATATPTGAGTAGAGAAGTGGCSYIDDCARGVMDYAASPEICNFLFELNTLCDKTEEQLQEDRENENGWGWLGSAFNFFSCSCGQSSSQGSQCEGSANAANTANDATAAKTAEENGTASNTALATQDPCASTALATQDPCASTALATKNPCSPANILGLGGQNNVQLQIQITKCPLKPPTQCQDSETSPEGLQSMPPGYCCCQSGIPPGPQVYQLVNNQMGQCLLPIPICYQDIACQNFQGGQTQMYPNQCFQNDPPNQDSDVANEQKNRRCEAKIKEMAKFCDKLDDIARLECLEALKDKEEEKKDIPRKSRSSKDIRKESSGLPGPEQSLMSIPSSRIDIEDKAATKIQSTYRGYRTRKSLKSHKTESQKRISYSKEVNDNGKRGSSDDGKKRSSKDDGKKRSSKDEGRRASTDGGKRKSSLKGAGGIGGTADSDGGKKRSSKDDTEEGSDEDEDAGKKRTSKDDGKKRSSKDDGEGGKGSPAASEDANKSSSKDDKDEDVKKDDNITEPSASNAGEEVAGPVPPEFQSKKPPQEEVEAATKIQATYRGYRTRKSLDKGKKLKAASAQPSEAALSEFESNHQMTEVTDSEGRTWRKSKDGKEEKK